MFTEERVVGNCDVGTLGPIIVVTTSIRLVPRWFQRILLNQHRTAMMMTVCVHWTATPHREKRL